MLRTDTCLIKPEDSPMLSLSLSFDGRILLLQPTSHLTGILLISPEGGFLWREIPAVQQFTDVANLIVYPCFF